MPPRDSYEHKIKSKPVKAALADLLSELCHELDPNSKLWTSSVRAKFNQLYSKLSEIDET